MLGLCGYVGFSPVVGGGGHSLVAVRRLLMLASFVVELLRPGIEPTSPSLANGFFTTEFPSGKP